MVASTPLGLAIWRTQRALRVRTARRLGCEQVLRENLSGVPVSRGVVVRIPKAHMIFGAT